MPEPSERSASASAGNSTGARNTWCFDERFWIDGARTVLPQTVIVPSSRMNCTLPKPMERSFVTVQSAAEWSMTVEPSTGTTSPTQFRAVENFPSPASPSQMYMPWSAGDALEPTESAMAPLPRNSNAAGAPSAVGLANSSASTMPGSILPPAVAMM